MDHNSLFTLKYSLSEWKELEYRKLVNDYLFKLFDIIRHVFCMGREIGL